jgi:hypothetical protein
MEHSSDIATLNALLAAEYGSLVHRLAEASAHVTWPAAGDHQIVVQMLRETQAHQAALAGAIIALRGSPRPPTYATSVGGLHYLKLSYLMPQVIAGVRGLVRLHESARLADAQAAEVVRRNLEDHRRHMAELERLHTNLARRAS